MSEECIVFIHIWHSQANWASVSRIVNVEIRCQCLKEGHSCRILFAKPRHLLLFRMYKLQGNQSNLAHVNITRIVK